MGRRFFVLAALLTSSAFAQPVALTKWDSFVSGTGSTGQRGLDIEWSRGGDDAYGIYTTAATVTASGQDRNPLF